VRVQSVLLLRVSSPVDKDVDHPQFFDPPYPLKYLQAGLAKYRELKVSLLDCWVRPIGVAEMVEHTAKIRPDLVVVSASSFDVDVANNYVSALRGQYPSVLVIGIGQGYYLNGVRRQDFDTNYDALLLGEPEQEFFRLFGQIRDAEGSSLEWKEHYRILYTEGKRFVVEDADRLPFPTYTPEELNAYRSIFPVRVPKRVVWGYLIATRGCPHRCMFCSEVMRVSTGKRLRSRSAVSVADEMEHLARQGVNICSFQDDSFSANRRFVESLCQELIARGSRMPWMARVRVDELGYDLLTRMKKSGCVMLGLGVESGSERIIRMMKKQENPKPWLELCRQAFQWIRALGIGTNAYYVIGNPTETREEIEQTIRFALELNSDSIQVHFYTPYPGSPAWEEYQDQLAGCDPATMFHYARPGFSLAAVPPDDLVKIRSEFYRRYLFRPFFALRHFRHYGAFYLHNPDILWTLLGIRKIL
jgi:anaerobic magnesium-protoporphyrin IX monomethyl ester cyclase